MPKKRSENSNQFPDKQLDGQLSYFDTSEFKEQEVQGVIDRYNDKFQELFDNITDITTAAKAPISDKEKLECDLHAVLTEISILQKWGTNQKIIAGRYRSAAKIATKIFDMTGDDEYKSIASRMEHTAKICVNHVAGDTANYVADVIQTQSGKAVVYNIPAIDPKLDPNSTEFDVHAWAAALRPDEVKPVIDLISKASMEMEEKTLEAANKNTIIDMLSTDVAETYKKALEVFSTYIESDAFKVARENISEIRNIINNIGAGITGTNVDRTLIPFIQSELDALHESTGENILLEEVLCTAFDSDGNVIDSKWKDLIERAKLKRDEFENTEKIITEIPKIFAKLPQNVQYPLDKVNSKVWNFTEEEQSKEQLFAMERKGSKREATVVYRINFDELADELSITKRLTPFDKRVYVAIAALYDAGNERITASQIYSVMGNESRPSANMLAKINTSLTKMGAARLHVDNTQEVQVNKSYPKFKYDAPLLPFERCTIIINNKACETAIKLYREPPLITFAKGRRQVSTIPKALFYSPISKTEINLSIDDYLTERILHMKSGKMSNKILFSTLYESCRITEKKQKQRTPDKIRTYLNYYKKCNFIKGYTCFDGGVSISFS